MKKLNLLLVLLFYFHISSYGQVPFDKERVNYCELTTGSKGFRATTKAIVDYGRGDEKLLDDQGKEKLFSSPVEALNFMHTKGWELVNLYRENGNTYYVLKRTH